MSQVNLTIGDAAGAVVRGNINAAIEAIITNNSGATEPTTTYPNMWWYDTSTALLKRRNNANDAWIVLGLEAADTDGTLAANSDAKVATQKATKTYVDAKTIAENRLSLSDNTTANASISAHGLLKKLSNVATEFMNGVGNWVAVTIDSILPTQTGNSGKFLTTNGTNASWGVVNTVPAYNYDSSSVIASSLTETGSSGGTYTKVKEITLYGSGDLTISFGIKGPGGAPRGTIYKNGSAIGTEQSGGTTYTTKTQSFSGFVNGDKIQLYTKNDTNTVQVNNFIIYGSQSTKNLE